MGVDLENLEAVPYAAAREKIRNGDILFCRGESTFSKIILRFTGAVSHVAKLFWWGDRLMVVESVETIGTRMVPLSVYVRGNGWMNRYQGQLYVGRVDSPGCDHAAALSWCLNHIPYPYDNREIARITARVMGLSPFDRPVDNRLFICSEFVFLADRVGGVEHPYSERGFIAPGDILASPHVEPRFQMLVAE